MKDNKEELKDRLRLALSMRNMKPADLCEITGISKSVISYYLSGKASPKADRVHIISKALDVSEAWLLGYAVPIDRTQEQKKNDDLVKIIAHLRRSPELLEIVSIMSDANLTPEQYSTIKQLLLTAFVNK